MLQAERQDRLIRLVNEKGIVTVEDLIREIGTSEATLRRDINELSSRGVLEKIRGGVRSVSAVNLEPSYGIKAQTNADEKSRIAMAAVSLIHPGEQIILDSGTTVYALACRLGTFHDLRVVTNDLYIALEVSTRTGIPSSSSFSSVSASSPSSPLSASLGLKV